MKEKSTRGRLYRRNPYPVENVSTSPLNWYSSRGELYKPMPTLQRWRLEVLELPRVAVVANPHGRAYDANEHECPAEESLPKTIRRLVVSQVDFKACEWVQAAFKDKQRNFPDWTHVELHFRDDYEAEVADGFEEASKTADVEFAARWRGEMDTIVELRVSCASRTGGVGCEVDRIVWQVYEMQVPS
jgi:hypothetical protein